MNMDMKLASEVANLLSCHDSGDVDATVRIAIHSLARIIADGEHLRHQVTDLQRSNTALEARARVAEADALCMRDVVRLNGADGIIELRAECDEAKADRDQAWKKFDEARAALAAETANANAYAHDRDDARRERDEANVLLANTGIALGWDAVEGVVDAAKRVVRERDELRGKNHNLRASYRTEIEARRAAEADRDEALKQRDAECHHINNCLSQRDEARAELASVTASRDALASSSVPVELARLYRATQGARAKWGVPTQRVKLGEECGEFITEFLRNGDRWDRDKVNHEAHDVLTVALSLCEPALMAKAAERLEGRLA